MPRLIDLLVGSIASAAPGWPDASNTGYQASMGALTNTSAFTINSPGTYELLNVTDGPITINASNVTVRKSVINGGYWPIDIVSGSNILIEDCTLANGGASGTLIESAGSGFTFRRLNIYGSPDGMKVGGSYVTVEDTFIHDLLYVEGSSHNDGVQCSSADHLVFNHNRIDSTDTSCIAMFLGQGTWSDVTITNNKLTGPVAYPIYAPGTSGTPPITVTDNVIQLGIYGYPVTEWSGTTGWTWARNVDLAGNPVNP